MRAVFDKKGCFEGKSSLGVSLNFTDFVGVLKDCGPAVLTTVVRAPR
jgi:hypothetical protein